MDCLRILATENFNFLAYNSAGEPVVTPENKHLWPCVRPGKVRIYRHKNGDTETVIEPKIGSQLDALRLLFQATGVLNGDPDDQRQPAPTLVAAGVNVDSIAGCIDAECEPTGRTVGRAG